MGDHYVGRHRRAGMAAGAERGVLARGTSALRPVAHAGASVALVGAAVGGYLVAGAAAGPQLALADQRLPLDPTTASLAAAAPAAGESTDALPADSADLRAGKLAAPVRLAAIATERAAAAAEAARLEAERAAAAERAARDAERAAVLANAQTNPKAVAAMMVAARGWSDAQFQCLNKLWTKESNWNYRATNRSSGAYGIPQSLPGSKMGTVASDWRTNPVTQITWGLDYIAGRYGTPCGAWGHSVRYNWY